MRTRSASWAWSSRPRRPTWTWPTWSSGSPTWSPRPPAPTSASSTSSTRSASAWSLAGATPPFDEQIGKVELAPGPGHRRLGGPPRRGRGRARQVAGRALPLHPRPPGRGLRLHGVGADAHPPGPAGDRGAQRPLQGAPRLRVLRPGPAHPGGQPHGPGHRERPPLPAPGRAGGDAGGLRHPHHRGPGARAAAAGGGDPRRDQPAPDQPLVPPAGGRGRGQRGRPRASSDGSWWWPRSWSRRPWRTPGAPSSACGPPPSTTSASGPAWRAWPGPCR